MNWCEVRKAIIIIIIIIIIITTTTTTTRPEESYRLWCVVLCDLEITKILVNEEEAKAH